MVVEKNKYRHFLLFLILSFLYAPTLTTLPLPDVEILIPMRDGVQLPTNIYLPSGSPGKYPCVLIRHPLGKGVISHYWLELVKEGYIVAVQSTRSTLDDTGKTLPYLTDGWGALADGHDAVEWLAKSEWCNGKVATVGASATGITQLLLAPSNPPHLVCQYIEVAAPSLYQYAIWPGGGFRKEQVEGWLKAHKRHPSVVAWLYTKREYDDFWRSFNAIDHVDKIQTSQLHIGGWFDIFLQGTIDAYIASSDHSLLKKGRNDHKLIIGPWVHRYRESKSLGDFAPLKEGENPPYNIRYKEWLDHHVKKVKNCVSEAPAVQYYVMGPFDGSTSSGNRWRQSDNWPPAGIEYKSLFFHLDKSLSFSKNDNEDGALQVLFDPDSAVPTIGGRNLFMADGPKDLRSIEARDDVMVFTTDTLQDEIEVTGRIGACLYVDNVAGDRDICLRITDVYPDGRSILIAEGVSSVVPNKDGSPIPVLVDLWSTSMVFAKGHKIRVIVSGSNFPAYEANLGQNKLISKWERLPKNLCFSIITSQDKASYIALPVMNNSVQSESHPEDSAT